MQPPYTQGGQLVRNYNDRTGGRDPRVRALQSATSGKRRDVLWKTRSIEELSTASCTFAHGPAKSYAYLGKNPQHVTRSTAAVLHVSGVERHNVNLRVASFRWV